MVRNGLAVAALAAVLGSAILLRPTSAFPGFNAIFPVVGTVARIWIGGAKGASAVNRLLGSRPLVAIRLVSYSLYLWHWPVVTIARQALFGDLTPPIAARLIGLTLLLAVTSWRFAERPFRTARHVSRRGILTASVVAIALSAVADLALSVTAGVPGRFPRAAVIATQMDRERAEDRIATCILGTATTIWPVPSAAG